ncbi:LysR family transcriptional regulator [Neoaquamicrobium sediminum]|uniref:LysR family transcriptional regulator n=1 Tax=Neoaquamicrobium sediminum TaxID=1849104 RepID=UPI001566AE23|nr:LysR family transcriptional regulator [Mesorhizobium sediminum]NRC57326.1 LysR family transcriptional regulator [Mesorhizobium sediminum]
MSEFCGAGMNVDNVDLNLLRVFDVLMRETSVTKAAVRLGKTQSAISHSLSKLRHLFKDELFSRDGGLMRPTPRAIELASDIAGALSTIRATIDRHQTFDPLETRRNFRIGLTDYHSIAFIQGMIQEFAKRAPKATLNVIPISASEVHTLIHSRHLDCALIGTSVSDGPNLLRIELGQDRLLCAVWSGSKLAREPISLDAYLAAKHIQISADGHSEGLADLALRERGLSRTVTATISNYLVIPWVLRGTEFITHCGDGLLPLLDEKSGVTLVMPPLPLPNVRVSLILHQQLVADPTVNWLREQITNIYSRWEIEKKDMLFKSNFMKWHSAPYATE